MWFREIQIWLIYQQLNSLIFFLFSFDFFIKLLYLNLILFGSRALSWWWSDVDRNIIVSFQVWWLKWGISSIVLFSYSGYLATISYCFISLSNILLDFNASSNLWLDISIVIACSLSNLSLILSLHLHNINWSSYNGRFFKISNIFCCNSFCMAKFIYSMVIFFSSLMLLLYSLVRIYRNQLIEIIPK